MFQLIFQNIWLLALVGGAINYFILKNRIRPLIEENPDLESGYDRLLNWIILGATLPWLIVGAAVLSGHATSVFDFFSPRTGNAYVQTFWVCIMSLWFGGMGWVVFGSGAEFLEQHPGVIRFKMPGVDPDKPTARQIRRSMIFFLIIGLIVFGSFLLGKGPPFPHPELPPTPPR